jgi:hypothetical protein
VPAAGSAQGFEALEVSGSGQFSANRLVTMISCGLIAQALESYDRGAQQAEIESAAAERAKTLELFPKAGWAEMPLDRYALGQPENTENLCYWLEFGATQLGSIKGGSARKHHIYWRKADDQWWYEENRYASVEEAWGAVRAGFVEALTKADTGQWEEIDPIPSLQGGPALLTKVLYVYFPDDVLPVYSHAHLAHFLKELGDEQIASDSLGSVALNRRLLDGMRSCDEVRDWSTKEMQRLLYLSEFSPAREQEEGLIGNVGAFVEKAIEAYGDTGIQTRREAEDQARALLDSAAGQMDEQQLRALLKLFNVDNHQGKSSQARFSPAFVGATANGLAANLDAVNEWTRRLWHGGQDGVSQALEELLTDRKLLPFAGTSYPTMLLYLRSPETFAVWLQPTDRGLQRLRSDYQPAKSPGAGAAKDYLAFSAVATGLMRDYGVAPELLDAVLAAASREEIDDPAATPETERTWMFQANPRIFDIDQAISEESEIPWVVRQYGKEIHAGDRVYLWRSGPDAGVIATATVLSDPKEMPGEADSPYLLESGSLDEAEPRVKLRIDAPLSLPLKRVDLLEHPVLEGLEVIKFANATNFRISPEEDAALRELLADTDAVTLPAVRAETAEDLFLPTSFLEQAAEMLADKKQVIFYGPPGTGKTWVAMALAKDLTRDGGVVETVQFHPSYAYEDFIGGFRPVEDDGSEGSIRYRRHYGPLRRIAEKASRDPGRPYILIIDEINRGNIPKIFGELLFLLEYRDKVVRLQYWPEHEFSLPENLFFIGTMNTADRSIALVDAALRRRFFFLEFSPNHPPVDGVLAKWIAHYGLQAEPASLLARLNEQIGSDDFAIGPSYFMNRDGEEPNLDRIWERSIMPLLHEHYFGGSTDLTRFELKALRVSLQSEMPSGESEGITL